jgi:hypothetical protein
MPSGVFKKLGGRYKRIRKRPRGRPNQDVYEYKMEVLGELEQLSEQEVIDLFYGDESHVCSEGYVPYGCGRPLPQFPGERVFIPSEKAYRLNCWGLISRQNECYWHTSEHSIDSHFVLERLDMLSLSIHKPTFIVLDNASIHTAKIIRARIPIWQKRGLYLFYLPTYSPQLNIAETMWRHLKGGGLRPEDYRDDQTLAYAVNRCLANVGRCLNINFSPFNAK